MPGFLCCSHLKVTFTRLGLPHKRFPAHILHNNVLSTRRVVPRVRLTLQARPYYSSRSVSSKTLQNDIISNNELEVFYKGPLSATFRNLKLFSLTSLSLASALTPFIFLIEAPLTLSARLALAATALTTSISSTALIAWCGKPYVISMRRAPESNTIELTTTDIFLRERRTIVLDPRFFQPTSRPFATWEIPESFTADYDPTVKRLAGSVEVIAVTCDGSGRVVGQCNAKWTEGDGRLDGVLHQEGLTIRCVD